MTQTLFSLLGLILIGACASVSVGTKLDETEIKNISSCQTTKEDLLRKFGKPSHEGIQSGFATMQWQYVKAQHVVGDNRTDSQRLIVFLNAKDVVVDFALNPISDIQVRSRCKR